MHGERLSGVMRGMSPCTECGERHTACHDKCQRYHDWKAEAQKVKDASKAYKDAKFNDYKDEKRREAWRRKTS